MADSRPVWSSRDGWTRRGFLAGLTLVVGTTIAACSGNGSYGGGAAGGGAAAPTTAAGGAAAPTTASGGGNASSGGASTATVSMTDANKFDPASVTISKGGTVTWKNTSSTQHTSTDDPSKAANKADAALPSGAQAWDSGMLNPGQTFSHSFDTAGTYKYFCIPHESLGMLGTVVVQ